MTSRNVGEYENMTQVGTGGMATVYRATHARLGREVAIKVMHKALLEDPAFIARFEREAKIVANLDHPNIVPVYDYDELDGQPYLVMKYIEGRTLKDMLRKGALPLPEIRRVMPQLADALHYAHLRGILHRDIKPSNVIVDERGTPYLTDFGLARIAHQGESTMSVDTMLGTPQYISPEQAMGSADLDTRTDVYSLGVVLYELVVGRVPFLADSAYAIVHKHIYAAPPDPKELNPDVTAEVNDVLMRALAKDPNDRYQTPIALMRAFEDAVSISGLTDLADDRQSVAAQRSLFISQHTPAGSDYDTPADPRPQMVRNPNLPRGLVQVPIGDDGYPFPAEPFSVVVSQLGHRMRYTIDSVTAQLTGREPRIDPTGSTATQTSSNEVITGISGKIREGAARFRKSTTRRVQEWQDEQTTSAPGGKEPQWVQRLREHDGKHNRIAAPVDADYSPDEAAIRRRVNKRLNQRRAVVGHTIGFLVVIVGLALVGEPALNEGLRELMADTDVQGEFARITNGVNFLEPLVNFPLALFAALLWGGGLIGHWLGVLYDSAGPLDRRRRKVVKELRAAYGPNWQERVEPYSYARVRKRVDRTADRHLRLIKHFVGAVTFTLASFVLLIPVQQVLRIVAANNDPTTNLLGGSLFESIRFTNQTIYAISEIPVPAIVAVIMGVLVLIHALLVALRGSLASEPRETVIAREIERERERSGLGPTMKAKPKREEVAPPRLTADGEFTDSFIDELPEDTQARS